MSGNSTTTTTKDRKCHVILFATPQDVLSVYLEPGGVTHHRFGDFHHDDAFDLPFGSKLRSRKDDSKFVYMLKPTPELWSRTLPHRTQIVWSRDAATITYKLKLKRGDVVVESGTGSGSLTHHFVRGVAPSGAVTSLPRPLGVCTGLTHLGRLALHTGRVGSGVISWLSWKLGQRS